MESRSSNMDMFSYKAHQQMNALMSRIADKYAEKYDLQVAEDLKSQKVSQDYIRQMRLLNPMYGFMNILCIGHPFLQYDAFIDKKFMKKYGIKMGHNYVWDRDPDFISDVLKYVSGPASCAGDGLKTAQAAQWVLAFPKSVGFVGTFAANSDLDEIIFWIGEMNLGHKIEPKADVKTSYQFIVRHGKRWSEVLIYDPQASCLSSYIDEQHFANALERAQLMFLSATSCLQMDMELTRLACFSSYSLKTNCIQIGKGVDLELKPHVFLDLVHHLDFLFISKKQALKLIDVMNIPLIDMWGLWKRAKSAALRIGKWMASLSKKICTVVVYDSIKWAYVTTYRESPSVQAYPSKFYNTNNIVDLYGCECAFSGGFLAQIIQGSEIETCIDYGFFCASAVATQMGANFPVNRLERLLIWQNKCEENSDLTLNCCQKCFCPEG